MDVPWILVSIAIIAVILAVLGIFVLKRKAWEREVDYRNYFNMGIIWLPFGIIFYLIFRNVIGLWFLIIGLAYLSIGLKNKDRWGKPQKISPKYQRIMMIAIALGLIILALGALLFWLMI